MCSKIGNGSVSLNVINGNSSAVWIIIDVHPVGVLIEHRVLCVDAEGVRGVCLCVRECVCVYVCVYACTYAYVCVRVAVVRTLCSRGEAAIVCLCGGDCCVSV